MSRALKIAFIILIIILVIAVILLLFLRREAPLAPSPEVNANVNAALPPVELNINAPTVTPPPVTDEEKIKTDIQRIASAFAERFGSYSNQSDFENIEDLKIFMTIGMQAWADDFVEKSRAERTDNSIYWGISTRALKTEILNFSEGQGRAEILVSTQRREAVGTTSNAKIYYQDMAIKFAREDGVWKVDEAMWK